MKIAIYTRNIDKSQDKLYRELFSILESLNIEFVVNKAFESGKKILGFVISENKVFYSCKDLQRENVDYFLTIGGDGTFLDALLFVKNTEIPVLGINAGSFGFLSNNPQSGLKDLLISLEKNKYIIEKRSVIEFNCNKEIFKDENYALNDFTIHKRDNSSLTAISAYLDGEFFNKYWGDGLLISTPTGSTAYNLSCNGPIVYPESKTFIITPVAPHNLNVRPVVIPDDIEISFEIQARDRNFLISLDSRYKIVDESYKIKITKSTFKMKTVRFPERNFSFIMREKLMWGIDKRNS